jgi:hypothetical protein
LKALREARKFALGGAAIGAAHLGGIAIKYSKAPHGIIFYFPRWFSLKYLFSISFLIH